LITEQEKKEAYERLKAEFSGARAAPEPQSGFSQDELAASRARLAEEFAAAERPMAINDAVDREQKGQPDPWSYTALEMTANAMLFDWASEVPQAVIARLASEFTDDPRSMGQIMMDMEELRKQRQEEYTQANPKAALATQIGGAIASPANLISGPAAMTAKLATMTGAAGTAARTAAVAGRGAAEGALYAAGTADAGEGVDSLSDGAAVGAGGALAGKAVLGGLGAVGGKLISRNIKGDLIDDKGEFVPINMVEIDPDSGFQTGTRQFYRDVIAPSFLGSARMKMQQDRVINEATSIADESKKILEAGLKKEAEAQKSLNEFVKAQEDVLKREFAIKSKEGGDSMAAAAKRLDNLRAKGSEYQAVASRVKSNLARRLEGRRVVFRTQALDEALPDGVSMAEREALFALPVREQNDRLSELWKDHGFKVIKDNNYKLDLDGITGSVRRILEEDVGLPAVTAKGSLGEKGSTDFADELRNLISGRLESGGFLSGEDAAKIRSLIGSRRSAAFQGDNPDAYRAYTAIQNRFDDALKAQLPPSAHKAWAADKAAYKTRVTFENASDKANTSSRDLLFTEDDWISAVAFGDKGASRGVGDRLQQEATAMRTVSRNAENHAKRVSDRYIKRVGMTMESEIARAQKAMDDRVRKLGAQMDKDKAALRTDSGAAERLAAAQQEIAPLQKAADETSARLEELRGLRSPEKPSWFHTLAATSLLGMAAKYLGGGLLVGAGMSRPLSSQTAQLAVAGQTGAQTAAREAVQKAQQSMIPQVAEGTLGLFSQGNAAGQTLRAINQAQRAAAARAGLLTGEDQR